MMPHVDSSHARSDEGTTPSPSADLLGEYRLKRGMVIFSAVLAALLAVFFVATGLIICWSAAGLGKAVGFILTALGLSGFLLVPVMRSSRLIVTADRITEGQWIGRGRTILWNEVIGYRFIPSNSCVFLYTKPSIFAAFKIGLTYANIHPLLQWISTHYPNLTQQEARASLSLFMKDKQVQEELPARLPQLLSARRWVKYSTLTMTGLVLWAFFFPKPYDALMWLLIVAPLWTVFLWIKFPGYLVLDGKITEARPQVGILPVFPWAVLDLRAFIDFHLVSLDWTLLIPWLALAPLLLFLLLYWKRKLVTILVVELLFFFLQFGPVLLTNYLLDASPPLRYPATIARMGNGEVFLSAWGPCEAGQSFQVSYRRLKNIHLGEPVSVTYHNGAWGYPYAFLDLR